MQGLTAARLRVVSPRTHMPVAARTLTLERAHARIHDRCLLPTRTHRIGVEIEWLTRSDGRQPQAAPILEALRTLPALPGGGTVTLEPGGQIELSSRALHPRVALREAASDIEIVRAHLASHGIDLIAEAFDTEDAIERLVDAPRYEAMEAYFDHRGAQGRTMMRRTAAIQPNLDAGPNPEERWRLLDALGPVLAAAFANSPGDGARSRRLQNWFRMDPTRTAPVDPGADPRDAWARAVLAANVMLIRRSDSSIVAMREDLTFARWITDGHELGFPTRDDLDYHVTTLFPPIRPRGWFELRMIDALPDPWWRVPPAIAAALVEDPEAAEEAARASTPARGRWAAAARDGLQDPILGESARVCFQLALPALRRVGFDEDTIRICEDFHERTIARGLGPADAWRGLRLVPEVA